VRLGGCDSRATALFQTVTGHIGVDRALLHQLTTGFHIEVNLVKVSNLLSLFGTGQ
jgi:hypothetical protein